MSSSDNDIKQPLNKNFREPKIRFPEFSGPWKTTALGELLNYEQPVKYIVSSENYIDEGTPVLTAGKSYILGYTDEKYGIKEASDRMPVIIFDDFTTDSRYINFNFKVKSSAIKILHTNKCNLFCVYEILQKIAYTPQDHQRHWISIFQKFLVDVPCLNEQDKIAKFMLCIEDLKINTENKISALKKYKQGLINNEFNETIMSWKYHNSVGTSLAHFLEEVNETAEKNGIYPHLTLSKDGIQEKTERYDRDFLVSTENKKYKITRLNQLCYNPANLKFGVICLNKYGDGIFSPIYVTFKIENINPIYLESLLTSQNFINYSLKFQEGTVYERMAVSVEDFTKIKIIPSDLVHQNTFSCVIEHIDSLIQIYTAKIAMLENIKNYLLTNMFI